MARPTSASPEPTSIAQQTAGIISANRDIPITAPMVRTETQTLASPDRSSIATIILEPTFVAPDTLHTAPMEQTARPRYAHPAR